MNAQRPLYQLFPLRPSAAQCSLDRLVSTLWGGPPQQLFLGPIASLDEVFSMMCQQPEQATQMICPYYFDQVYDGLPNMGHVRESRNLRLPWFDSWADLEREKQRAAKLKAKRWLQSARGSQPSNRIHPSHFNR